MDESVLITAAAAMMHDLGKLTKEGGLEITKDYENNNAGLYQPFYSGRYTHDHALYTARFIEEAENLLPPQLKGRLGTSNQSFINLAARHHKPETPWEWIIAISDRISSGWDRANFDSEYNAAINWRDYRKTRLLSAFEYLLRDDEKYLSNYDSYKYCYPLRELSPTAIFPILKKEGVPAKDAEAKDEYKRLYDNFFNDLKGLRHREDNLALWLDHFDSLMLIYTANIPAARAGTVIPDVSLYDHARATAAIAAALYSYHREHNTLTEEAVRNESSSVFLLIGGDFYGIQNYIFCDSGETLTLLREKVASLGASAIRSAVLYAHSWGSEIPDYIGLITDALILNPWDREIVRDGRFVFHPEYVEALAQQGLQPEGPMLVSATEIRLAKG